MPERLTDEQFRAEVTRLVDVMHELFLGFAVDVVMAALVAMVANGLCLNDRHNYDTKLKVFVAQVRQWMTLVNKHDAAERRQQTPWIM